MNKKSEKRHDEGKELRIDKEELEALSARVAERKIEEDDWQRLHQYLVLLLKLTNVLEYGRVRMRKLMRLLFGKRTEKDKTPEDQSGKDKNNPPPNSPAPAGKPDAAGSAADGSGKTEEAGPDSEPEKESHRKGHGRHPASAYENASEMICPVCGNQAGEPCPACGKGRLRKQAEEIVIRIKGSAPVTADKYRIEKLRCDACGLILKGKLPEEAGEDKYQASAKVSVVMLKYGSGLPFYRLEKQQAYQQIPLPVGTQWDLVEEVANAVHPVYLELERTAAEAELLFIDDTWNLVLKDGKKQHTTGVVARVNNHWVTLYLTGTDAAGKKVLDLLQQRPAHLPRPLQMSDALASNYPDPMRVVVVLCWIHARRQFFEIKDFYPQECAPVLEAIRSLYQHEKQIVDLQLDDAGRLAYHRQHSQPVLEDMKKWLQDQQDQRLIEPNSPLGKAVQYLKTHWDGLMGFCRYPGAPLDNNVVERILKDAILIRKNAYFFKTSHGANVGSLLMSMIKTATQAGVNPFSYLQALLDHRHELRPDAGLWLPWNYRSVLRI
jgi:transposase